MKGNKVRHKFSLDLIFLVQNKFHEISSQLDVSILNLSNKLQESLTFGVELEKTRCPKFVWLKCSKQRMETKKKHHVDLHGTKYTVHIVCKTLTGLHMHEVENQEGIEIKVESGSSAKFKKILKYTLLMLSTLNEPLGFWNFAHEDNTCDWPFLFELKLHFHSIGFVVEIHYVSVLKRIVFMKILFLSLLENFVQQLTNI